MADRVDAVVIGAGVVGLACARALALSGREVIVLESEDAIGTATSSRNSEVIHAGLYYPTGSLKAALCVAGRAMLYAYCESRGVAHRRTGKLLVAAAPDEIATLRQIAATASANGVTGTDMLAELDRAAIRALEPEIQAVAGLFSPSTGIIDSHGLMLAYQGDLEAAGGLVALRHRLVGIVPSDAGFHLEVMTPDGPAEIVCEALINAAGLGAQNVATAIDGFPPARIPRLWLVKGNYFTLSGRTPFRHLVYPVPAKAGLGVHVTLDLAGRARFGPDVEYLDRIDYKVDPARAGSFYEAIRRYWPGLADGALSPAYSGIRPKLQGPDEPFRDFVIDGPPGHGIGGLVNLFGIESPGLTASLAIAHRVVALLAA